MPISLEELQKIGEITPIKKTTGSITLEELERSGKITFPLIKTPEQQRPLAERGAAAAVDFTKGGVKGGISTAVGVSSLGERLLNKPFELAGINKPIGEKTSAEKLVPERLRTPEGTAQKIGFGAEQIGEFFVPGGQSSRVASLIEKAKAFTKAPQLIRTTSVLAGKSLTEAGIVGGQTALQQGTTEKDAGTAALIGGALPLVGKAASRFLESSGAKIQMSVLKPTINDVKSGFKIENVSKHKLGGSLDAVLSKSSAKLKSLVDSLDKELKGTNVEVDLEKVFLDTYAEMIKGKAKNFGSTASIERVLSNLAGEIDSVAPGLKANLVDATNIKRGAGTKGSWVFGSGDPDATAVERVYTTFYNKLKTEIESLGGSTIQKINKQISEIIPIQSAAIRRLPIDARNNLLSLTDTIGLTASIFDPKALALLGAKKLSTSGTVANVLSKASRGLKNIPLKIGERLTQ